MTSRTALDAAPSRLSVGTLRARRWLPRLAGPDG